MAGFRARSRWAPVLLVGWCSTYGFAYVSMPWSSTYYGADGPWQAITVEVGGFVGNGTTASDEWTKVDCIPGNLYNSFFLSSALCTSETTSDCGAGGTWDTVQEMEVTAASDVVLSYSWSGLYMSGPLYAQGMRIGTVPQYTLTDVSLISVDAGNQTYRNNHTVDLDVSVCALGAPAQTWPYLNTSITTSDMPTALYDTGDAESNSFGLQIGSTGFEYPGSLLLGGYDKGRAIGPATTWSTLPPNLLDIVIGVEMGTSPFSFENKTGLLAGGDSSANGLPIWPLPAVPYISLPQQTIDNIVTYLPVEYDDASGYYLWETTSPHYSKITTSPAYLGFVFEAEGTSGTTMTIKVPFSLLNLNLTETASSKVGTTSYFPVAPFVPDDDTTSIAGNEQNSYPFGRAFLQAAFLARNWNADNGASISWLAQAPGPGASKDGLGVEPVNMPNDTAALTLHTGDSLFADSWSAHWTVLSTSSPSPAPTTTAHSGGGGGGGLSGGDDAGIAIGVIVAVLIVVGLLLFMRRRHKRRQEQEHPRELEAGGLTVAEKSAVTEEPVDRKELQGSDKERQELYVPPSELEWKPQHAELPAEAVERNAASGEP